MKKIEGHYSIVELKKRACPDVVNLDNLYQMHEAAVGEQRGHREPFPERVQLRRLHHRRAGGNRQADDTQAGIYPHARRRG